MLGVRRTARRRLTRKGNGAITPDKCCFRPLAGPLTIRWIAPIDSTNDGAESDPEFGSPFDNDASDDFLITRDEFTVSYSKTRNTPN